MTNTDYDFIRGFVKDEAAIIIDPVKDYLLEFCLEPLAKDEGFASLRDLITEIRFKPTEQLSAKIVDALTINETFFFRDDKQYAFLKDELLTKIIKKNAHEKKLNIWCAASSSGQEPYSVAMLLMEQVGALNDWEVCFIASDISDSMLAAARVGMYTEAEVNRGLPLEYRDKYLEPVEGKWQVKQAIRDMVTYQKINLKNDWILPKMDLVFMRNVLIYFNAETKTDILNRVKRTLNSDGFLLLGGAETTLGLCDKFERLDINGTSCYTPNLL